MCRATSFSKKLFVIIISHTEVFFFRRKITTVVYTKKEYTYYDCNGGNEVISET